jgi:protein-tyrosine phosphatase
MSMSVSQEQFAPAHGRPATIQILFLCTGNYYRSRFAEEIFNHLAAKESLPCRATSLGFSPHPEINPGKISAFTLKALADRDIPPRSADRSPTAVESKDFLRFRFCIAMSEVEHQPMMQTMFPSFLPSVRFWQVEDLAWEASDSAIAKIESEVFKLINEIRQESRTGPAAVIHGQ